MSLQKESSLLLQKYKLAFEEHQIVKEKFNEGNRDLTAHLEIFQKRLSDTIKNQKEKFKQQFFPDPVIEDSESLEDSEENPKDSASGPDWVKKVYRSIVLSTHPDKTSFIPVDSVREKLTSYYQLAVESYSSKEYENLLFIADDIGVEINDDVVLDLIKPKLEAVIADIARIKKTIAFEWSHIENNKKIELLENYLKSFGYVFDRNDVEEVIEEVKRNKRKVGTRPVNHIKNRIKS